MFCEVVLMVMMQKMRQGRTSSLPRILSLHCTQACATCAFHLLLAPNLLSIYSSLSHSQAYPTQAQANNNNDIPQLPSSITTPAARTLT